MMDQEIGKLQSIDVVDAKLVAASKPVIYYGIVEISYASFSNFSKFCLRMVLYLIVLYGVPLS